MGRYLYRYRHLVENRFLDFQASSGHCCVLREKIGFICGGNRKYRIIAMYLKIKIFQPSYLTI